MALPSTNSFYQACFLEQLFTFAEKQKANLALIHLRKGTRADTKGLGALLHLFTFGRKFNGRKFNGRKFNGRKLNGRKLNSQGTRYSYVQRNCSTAWL